MTHPVPFLAVLSLAVTVLCSPVATVIGTSDDKSSTAVVPAISMLDSGSIEKRDYTCNNIQDCLDQGLDCSANVAIGKGCMFCSDGQDVWGQPTNICACGNSEMAIYFSLPDHNAGDVRCY